MKLKFNRTEYKYYVPGYLFDYTLNYLFERMNPDEHNKNFKPYSVRSLYFDTFDLMHYWEKIDGNPYRKKIRIRSYESSNQGPVFLEIKNKSIEKIYKERVVINDRRDEFLSSFDFSAITDGTNDVVSRCFTEQKLHNIAPKVLVSYKRTGFSDKEIDFRVTVDSDIMAAETSDLWVHASAMEDVLCRNFIVEVKFDKFIPDYFKNFVMENNLQRVPYCKYTESIDQCLHKTF